MRISSGKERIKHIRPGLGGGEEMGMHKGQMTFVAVVLSFIALVVFAALLPAMMTTLASAKATMAESNPSDTFTPILLDLVPAVTLGGILMGIIAYGIPWREG